MGTPIRDEKRLLAAKRAVEEQAAREADTAGMSGGRRRMKAPAESEAEIEGYGKLLGQHLMQLHGGAFHKAFARGLAAYGNPDVTGEKVQFDSVASKKLKGGNRMVGAGLSMSSMRPEGEMGSELISAHLRNIQYALQLFTEPGMDPTAEDMRDFKRELIKRHTDIKMWFERIDPTLEHFLDLMKKAKSVEEMTKLAKESNHLFDSEIKRFTALETKEGLSASKRGSGPLKLEIEHESSSDEECEKSGGALTGRYEGEGRGKAAAGISAARRKAIGKLASAKMESLNDVLKFGYALQELFEKASKKDQAAFLAAGRQLPGMGPASDEEDIIGVLVNGERDNGLVKGEHKYLRQFLSHLDLPRIAKMPAPMAPKKEEGPAHKADQRKVRGALIKAVKAKHGLASVIEANKYVSAHGLWPMTPDVAREYGL